LLGAKRTEITSLPVRFWTVTKFPNFIVVYRPDGNPLQVIAVIHGKRDMKALLEESGVR
jgi:plasmid stabilization system protein ParE